jgi:hypothetical protein
MKKYCINCGSGTEFSSVKPKFCSGCGHNFDTSFAGVKPPVKQTIERKIKPNISLDNSIEIDNDDDFDHNDVNHVPNINELNVDYEVQKYQGIKFNKMMDSPINPSFGSLKKEKIKGKKVSKKDAQEFFDNFSKEAGAIRPKNKRK